MATCHTLRESVCCSKADWGHQRHIREDAGPKNLYVLQFRRAVAEVSNSRRALKCMPCVRKILTTMDNEEERGRQRDNRSYTRLKMMTSMMITMMAMMMVMMMTTMMMVMMMMMMTVMIMLIDD